MTASPFIGLVQNVALLLALVLIFDLVEQRLPHWQSSFRQIFIGVLIGAIGVSIMLTPWVLMPGAIFDTRSILLSVSGLFFGIVPTVIAMAITAVFRLALGGNGTLTGILVIFATGTLGLVWRHFHKRPVERFNWKDFYLFGLVTHFVMLILMLTFPWEVAQRVLTAIGLPILVIYPLGTVLLGTLLVNQKRRNRTEDALRESEARYRNTLESMLEGCQIIGFDWRYLYLNDASDKHNRRTKGELLGKKYIEAWPGIESTEVFAALRCCLEERTSCYMENEFTFPDGSKGWFDLRISPVPEGVVILSIDTTERKRIENSLREANEYLENLFDYANAPIIVWDPQFRITRFNHAFETLTGRSAAEMIGKTLEIFFPPDQVEASMKLIQKTLSGERWEVVEINIQHVDGTIRTVIWNSATLFSTDGTTPIATIAQGQDISERKQAEDELEKHHATLNAILESAAASVFSLDRNYCYTSFNSAHAATMKTLYRAEIEIGKNMLEYQTIAEDREEARRNLDRVLHGEQIVESAYSGEQERGRRYFEIAHNPICGTDGEIIGVSVFVNDLTERKQAEESLQEYSTRLETEVAQRTRELRETQEQLVRQERLAVLGQLAGSIGHELRNPLGVISNAVYFLKMAQADASDKVKEYLDIIEKETRTSDKIVTDLLDFTRIKSLDRKPVSVSKLLEQTLQRHPTPTSIKTVLEIPADLPKVYVDPQHMTQVFGNLISNACQSMISPAGIISTNSTNGVSTNGKKLTICASAQSDMINITVQDMGVGIPPENMQKIFEPLFTTKIKGIGLGLAVSQKLVEANSGRIEVESEPGKGSTFMVYLPIYRQEN